MVMVANVPGGVSTLAWNCQVGSEIANSTYSPGEEKLRLLLGYRSNKRVTKLTGHQTFEEGVHETHNKEQSYRARTRAPPTRAQGLLRREMAPTLDS